MGSGPVEWDLFGWGGITLKLLVIAFRKYMSCHVWIGAFTSLNGIITVWGPVEWALLGWGGKLLVIAFRKYHVQIDAFIIITVWGPVEWVEDKLNGLGCPGVIWPKWPKNYISLSSTLSFGNSKWLIFVRYVFLLQVPNLNRMAWPATSSPWINKFSLFMASNTWLQSIREYVGIPQHVKAVLPLGLNPLKSLHRISFEADLPHQQTPSLWRALLQTEEFRFSSLPLCTSPLQTSQPPPGLPFQSHQLSRSGQRRDCSIPHPCSWSVVSGHLEGWYYCSNIARIANAVQCHN